MIRTIVTHTCPKCGSEQLVRNGHEGLMEEQRFLKEARYSSRDQ